MLCVKTFVNKPVTSNCYVLFDKEKGNDCIIVDPGSKSEAYLIEYIDREGLHPWYIILTHEHFDHCWGVNELVKQYHIPIISSQLCTEAIKDAKNNCSVFYDNSEAFIIDTDTISVEVLNFKLPFGGDEIKCYMTPGHTDASISFTIGKCLFTGDALIKEMRTVTKLPTGSVPKLKDTVEMYRKLQGKGYKVFAGHGGSFLLDGYDLDVAIHGLILI